MSIRKKRITGVSFDLDVIEHLDKLCQLTDRNRSWLINAIVREHARQLQEARLQGEPQPKVDFVNRPLPVIQA